MNLKVSILTVSYQSAATLRQTIESVLAQDYPNVEYWVIDGGSTDGSLEILKSFGSSIHFISEKDAGIYDAMNKGLKLIQGDVIGMIGADDFYPSNDVISSVVATFESNQVDVVYGDKQYVNPENPQKIVRYWTAGAYIKKNNGFTVGCLRIYLFILKSLRRIKTVLIERILRVQQITNGC